MNVSPAFCHAAVQKAASQVVVLESVPTMGEEQLGSVKVEDNVGERATGFVSLREWKKDNINLKAKDLKAAEFNEHKGY